MTPSGGGHSIMVVDDEPANLKLLETMLRRKGHEVRSFPRGRMALASAEQRLPDLILLDVNMPEMNGYEVCEHLKADPRLSEIPILFLSALHDTEDKVKCFRVGGLDFISKPFQLVEVYARVELHLKLHDLQQALKQQNEHLEETVASRTSELADAHAKLGALDRAKDEFLQVISHEFRTPLNGLLGVGDIVLDQLPASEENDDLRLVFDRCRQGIVSLLDDALLLTQIDLDQERMVRPAPVSLGLVVRRAIERAVEFADSCDVTLPQSSGDLGNVRGQEDLLVRAIHALLDTAVRLSEVGGSVRLSHDVVDESPRIVIESDGSTIPDADLEKFFDVFSMREAITQGKGSFGLGPSVAYRLLSLSGGTTTVMNRASGGIRLTVSF